MRRDYTRGEYVSYNAFGRCIAERLNVNGFTKQQVMHVLWFADETGRDGLDRRFVDGEPRIAVSEKCIENFLKILPYWRKQAEKNKRKEPLQWPELIMNEEARYAPRKNSKLYDVYKNFSNRARKH